MILWSEFCFGDTLSAIPNASMNICVDDIVLRVLFMDANLWVFFPQYTASTTVVNLIHSP